MAFLFAYVFLWIGPQYADAQLNPMGSWAGPLNTQYIATIAGSNPLFTTRSFYRAGPTCSISSTGTSAYCWWPAGSAPLSGASHSVSTDDPSFFITIPSGLSGKIFISVTVATDIWLLTDVGEIVIAFWASGTDKLPTQTTANRLAQLNSGGFTSSATGVILPSFASAEGGALNPVLSISVHPFPSGSNANAGFAGRRDFCTIHADGDTRCWSLILSTAGISASYTLPIGTLQAGGWYDISSSVVAATNVCGSPTAPSGASIYTMTTSLCTATGVPQTRINFLNVPPRGYSTDTVTGSAYGMIASGSPLGANGCDLSGLSIKAVSGESSPANALTRWWQICTVDAAGTDACFGYSPTSPRTTTSASLAPCPNKASYSIFTSSFDVNLPSPAIGSIPSSIVSLRLSSWSFLFVCVAVRFILLLPRLSSLISRR